MRSRGIILFGLAMIPFYLLAQAVTAPIDLGQAAQFLPTIIAAAKNGQWLAAGAFLSIVLTFLVKQYVLPKLGVGSAVLPWVSIVVGILGGVGLAVANGALPTAAILAVLSGPVGSSLYSAIIKYFLPSSQA